MNRKERRAAAHQQRKLDRKAGFPTIEQPPPTTPAAAVPPPPAKPPVSEAKLNANRLNAQHSTGPTSETGRSTSSQNRTVHGLARRNGPFKVLEWEDAADFDALKAGLVDEHQPSTPTEIILVNSMAESYWLANRAQYLSNSYCDKECGLIEYPRIFSLYLRYETTYRRAFHKALNDLLRLKAERRKAEVGFEAQKRKTDDQRIKNEKHEMKKQVHHLEILRKRPLPRNKIPASRRYTTKNWRNKKRGTPPPPNQSSRVRHARARSVSAHRKAPLARAIYTFRPFNPASRLPFSIHSTHTAMSVYRSALLLISFIGLTNAAQAPAPKVVFEKDVLPIFQQACARCHLGDASMGKLHLGSEADLLRGGSSGPSIVTGKSADSLLVKRILGLTDAQRMPMGGDPLSNDQIKMIRAWIDQGNLTTTASNKTTADIAKAPDSPLFAETIRPLLAARCYSCHGPDVQQNGLRLDSLGAILKGSDSGRIVVPGKPDSSRLLRRLQAQERPMMPYGGPALSTKELDSIREWIAAGAPGPDATTPIAATKPPKHWAYVKPVRPDVPSVSNTAWCRNPIDNFILAKLDSEGLKPSPEADKRTLIRRVYLDLIGLPPTPAEVDAFLADTTPDAYEKVVDRLQASPRYGERWARPWLDLARYADSNGYEKDNPRVAWEYRDWVIRALNQDMPFNQFTIEQLAGDMLPNPTNDQLIATGFHRNSMLNQEGGIDVEEYYWYSLVDRVNTTASVWLGSTLGCAQCHNHKFDPFPQKDYYRMIAFFSNAEHKRAGAGDYYMAEPELALPTPAQDKTSKELRAKMTQLQAVLDTQTPELDTAQQAWEKEMNGSEVSLAGAQTPSN